MIKWLEVVLNVPVFQTYTYKIEDIEDAEKIRAGMRVEVYFGNRKTIAYCIKVMDELPSPFPYPIEKIKPVKRIIDKEALFTDEQIALSSWISRYYICAPGEALAIMLPSAKREGTLQETDFSGEEFSFENTKKVLSHEQESCIAGILQTGAQSIQYVYGATGSGKTEVFLQVAQHMLDNAKGVIYLVPEIALTHQVVEAVVRRFGNTAAVLHSGLTQSQKLTEWMRILHSQARVVIGARSAVFAPVPNLGTIIIDEEHDGSYKSGNSPRYHARQVALKRCAQLQIPLIMGSATPSAEVWQLMQSGSIKKYELTQRLSGGEAPKIEVVQLGGEDGCISAVLEKNIRQTKEAGRQTILFLNRRGFTHFFRCNTCGFELKCKNCSVSLTYHKSQHKMKCHYCGWSITSPSVCPECNSLDVGYAGFGTEYIEAELSRKFPSYSIARVDTDTVTQKGELQRILSSFRCGDIDILLGTQMIAKGLNFPKVQLVGVVLADTGLHLPDFRASERTFALIVQVAGRAGRFFPDGKVIVQSYNPNRAAIAYACSGDYSGFYEQELEQRKVLQFPPFSRLVRLVFRSKDEQKAVQAACGAFDIMESYIKQSVQNEKKGSMLSAIELLGPSECPLGCISNNHRQQIILRHSHMPPLQTVTAYFIHNYTSPCGVYIEVDVDPVNLL